MYLEKDKKWLINLIDENTEHFKKCLDNTELKYKPYKHFYAENVFTEDFLSWLDWLWTQIPEEHYGELNESRFVSDSYASGRKCFFAKGTGNALKGVISDDKVRMHFRGLLHFAATSIKPTLINKFLLDPTKGKAGSELLMIEDYNGFYIDPHTDSETKMISSLFYLPQVDEIEGAGTLVLESDKWIDPTKNQKMELFKTAFHAPFKRNSLFAFKRSDWSWHAVNEYDNINPRRLMLYYIRQ